MDSILLIVNKPTDNDSLERRVSYNKQLSPKLGELQRKYKDTELLSENVLLIKATDISCLVEACDSCIQHGHTYRCLFFAEPPQWVYSTNRA